MTADQTPTRRRILGALSATGVTALAGCLSNEPEDNSPSPGDHGVAGLLNRSTMYVESNCTHCEDYKDYLEAQSEFITIETETVDSLTTKFEELNVPEEMHSTHVLADDEYFLVGHIPVVAIAKLVGENPRISGLSLPGTPQGAPGIGGEPEGRIQVYEIDDGLETGIYHRV